MSRIRSVHPGLHTDERFVSVQPFARLLFIGIWNECDDKGVFEWSPLKLKMRLLPADNVDATQLLDELASAGMVLQYEIDGRRYGAVRNFGKWQRPKKPNSVHPASEQALAFAASGSAPVEDGLPTSGGKSPQRKEEGGRGKAEAEASGENSPKPPAPAAIDLKAAIFSSGVSLLVRLGVSDRNARSMLGRWRSLHGDGRVLDAIAAAENENPSDPITWLTRTLDTRNGKRPHHDRPSAWGGSHLPLGAVAADLDQD